MTLSEYVQAHRIGELIEGMPDTEPEALRCGDGTTVRVIAGAGTMSHPETDVGPWTQFEVLVRHPGESIYGAPGAMPAGDLVRLLERLGWPEAQLGKRWKKRGVAARK